MIAAEPFPHRIVDDALDSQALDEVFAALDDEPAERYETDIYAFEATPQAPSTDAWRALRDGWLARCERWLWKPVARADLRGYAYRAGSYLLPHTDWQEELGRVIAYAYYLPTPEPFEGGELELFRGFESAKVIEPRPNRLVLFEVSQTSLHQVREVMSGTRLSLAGWFYAS